MNLLSIAAEWWLKWLFGILAAGLVAMFRTLWKRQKALENGMQAILRDRILTSYYHYHKRGNITLHGLENVEKMFESYEALHGNGTVPHLVASMREMEVVDE